MGPLHKRPASQFDVEASGAVHLPHGFSGGIDVKLGQFVTLLRAEFINAPDNLFYSHSYIFNFGVPLKASDSSLGHIGFGQNLYGIFIKDPALLLSNL